MNLDQLSVEEYINSFQANECDIPASIALNLISSSEDDVSPSTNVSSPCEQIDFIDPKNCGIDKNEFDLYLSLANNFKDNTIVDSGYRAFNDEISNLFGQAVYDNTQVISKSKNVLLSRSVGVTMPKNSKNSSRPIEIVDDLEPNYKPRYKSDYFSQEGRIRKPRYVSDQKGNHYVTLKVSPGIQGAIRIDWVTVPTEKNIRYSMPYKFQTSNKSLDIPDCNPIYIPIDADRFGIMKLFLVLIKSKQDALKKLQPLQLFSSFEQVLEIINADNLIQIPTLMPKQLIQKYQLDKSQLAFTFCTLSPDGKTYAPDWNTTIYSTVLTEISADASKKRKTTCPKCLHSFEVIVDAADDIGHEKIIKKRKK